MTIIYSKNPKKYGGSIFIHKDSIMYRSLYKGEYKSRFYPFSDEESKKKALEDAFNYKVESSIKNNLIINQYEEIKDGYKVYLNCDKFMYVDKEDIDLIEDFIWRIQNNKKVPTTIIRDKSIINNYKKYLLKLNPIRNFDTILNRKNKFIKFVSLKYGYSNIIYKNDNILDYRKKNIYIEKLSYFNKQLDNTNQKTFKNNILYFKNNNENYYEIKAKKGKSIFIRKFDIKKFGKLIAKKLANEIKIKLIENKFELLY